MQENEYKHPWGDIVSHVGPEDHGEDVHLADQLLRMIWRGGNIYSQTLNFAQC